MDMIILTPARDEEDNLTYLYDSIVKYSDISIIWYIFENGSTDRTLEVANNFPNHEKLRIIVNSKVVADSYSVGNSLSNLLSDAFDFIKNQNSDCTPKYFCILDADVNFDENFLLKLTDEFKINQNLQLVSGIGLNNGKHDGEGNDHVRGNARIWRWEYISTKGIPRGPAWDSISKFEVLMDGYDAYPIRAFYNCREMGAKQENFYFYGYAAYYRGVSLIFVFFKTLKMFIRKEGALSYLKGYLTNAFVHKEISDNESLREYVRHYSIQRVFNWLKF